MVNILSNIKLRIFQYLEHQGIKKEDFYSSTGISSSNFKGAGLKSDPGGDKIAKILTIYKNINPDWLLQGDGTMLRSTSKEYKEVDILATKANESIANYKVKQRSFISRATQEQQRIEERLTSGEDISADELKALVLASQDLSKELLDQFSELYEKNLQSIEFINQKFLM